MLKEQVFIDNGDQLSGVSVAIPWQNQLLMGAVCQPQILSTSLADQKRMNLIDWQNKGGYAQIGEHRIFHQEEGRGETLLLLHAYPTASWGWHKVWPELTRRFHVIAPDLLGSGFSDKPEGEEYSILALADHIESLLRQKGVKSFHVLAHAYGSSSSTGVSISL